MFETALRRAMVVSLFCAAGFVCAVAAGQEPSATPPAPQRAAPAASSDDILVQGHSPAEIRADLERAEDAFYDRFNAINSSDDFDIVCELKRFTGSKMPRRVCLPKFARAAQERAGRDELNGLHGSGFTSGSGQFAGRTHYGYQQLEAEIRKLSAEDPQLRELSVRLGTLQRAYQEATNSHGDQK